MTRASFSELKLEIDPPVSAIFLNRPHRRNALSRDLMREIVDAIAIASDNADVAGLLIAGSPEVFSAGADLAEAVEIRTMADFRLYSELWTSVTDAIELLPKPVIACISGYCYTGGLELALACDLRIAARGSSFAVTSAGIGSVPGFGATQRLPRLVGTGQAKRMLFAADPISAEEALRIGLVEQLVPVGQAEESGRTLIRHYATRAPLSLAMIKSAVNNGMEMELGRALRFEAALAAHAFGTEDKEEGMRAFLEKRTPSFRGK